MGPTAVGVQTMAKAVLEKGLPLTNPPADYRRSVSLGNPGGRKQS